MTTLRYGYISNGFADHTLEQMAGVLARYGYQGLGLTLDPRHLDPFAASAARLREVRALLDQRGLRPVIETGARYVLDPLRKHAPNLLSHSAAGRAQRLDYYLRAIDIAAGLGAGVVSIWSGAAEPGAEPARAWGLLEEQLPALLAAAAARGITIGFEPEPGMFVESLSDWLELKRRVPHGALRMTLDLGHLAITESAPLEHHVERLLPEIVNVHIDDVRGGRHEHLPLGAGEIDFAPLLEVLRAGGYAGLVLVELSRHSHEAPLQAERSMAYLRALEGDG